MSSLPTRTDISGTPSKATAQAAFTALFDFIAQRLAAGTSGAGAASKAELQTSRDSLGLADYTGRSLLINGCCRIAQGGNATFSASGNKYGGADMWLGTVTGTTVAATMSRVTSSSSASGYAQQIGSITTTGTSAVKLCQLVESLSARKFNGRTVTFSGVVKQTTGGAKTLTIAVRKANAVDNFAGGVTLLGSTTLSVPNGADTPFSFTLALGASDASNGLGVHMDFDGMGALTGASFIFQDMIFESGSVVTAVPMPDVSDVLAQCQRHYCKTFPQATAPAQNTGVTAGAISFAALVSSVLHETNWFMPVTMRDTPHTITTYSPNAALSHWSTNSVTPTASIGASGPSCISIKALGTITAGLSHTIHATADARLYL